MRGIYRVNHSARWNSTLAINAHKFTFAINHNSPAPNVVRLQPLFVDFMHNLWWLAGTFNWPPSMTFPFIKIQTQIDVHIETFRSTRLRHSSRMKQNTTSVAQHVNQTFRINNSNCYSIVLAIWLLKNYAHMPHHHHSFVETYLSDY